MMNQIAFIAAWFGDLKFRLRVLAESIGSTLGSTARMLYSNAMGTIGVIRWVIFPRRYSIAHMEYTARIGFPFGHRWIPDGHDRLICTACKTGHPMDFLEFAIDHTRWEPAAAHEEALVLIQRGEMEDTADNHNRWADIPEGFAVLWSASTTHPDHALPMLVALNYKGDYYSTCLSHLGDLREWEFDLFASWVSEVMPEWQLQRDGPNLQADYISATDPMVGVNPYAFLNPANQPATMTGNVVVINVHEEDEHE